MLATIYGLKQVAQDGLGWLAALSIAAGLVLGVVFVRRQRALDDPLLDLRLFRAPALSAALVIATLTLSFFAVFAAFLLIAQYLQLVLGLAPLRAGLWTLPSAGGLVAGSMLAPLIVRRMRPASAITGGLVVAATGFALLTRVGPASGLTVVVTASVILALGIGAVGTPATDLIVGTAPPARAGAASALSETSSELGGALGIAVLATVTLRGTRPGDAQRSAQPAETSAPLSPLPAASATSTDAPSDP